MKKNIRVGMFETNSSSTHSLSIKKGSSEDVKQEIIKRIIEYHSDLCEIDDYIKLDIVSENNGSSAVDASAGENILILSGLYFEDGDEEKCVYYILKSWIAKVQYISALLKYNMNEIPEMSDSKFFVNIENTKAFKAMEKAILETYQALPIENKKEIKHVRYSSDFTDTRWVDDYEKYFNRRLFNNPEAFENAIKGLLDPEISMVYMDEAYSPYMSPSITIL